MVTSTYSVVCTRKTLIAPAVYEIVLTKPEGFVFQAGQFVLFDVPLLEDPKDTQPRAYSIASSPEEKDLLFVIKLKPGGRASRWVEHELGEGTVVAMKGPFGMFLLRPPPPEHCFLIATGSGIAPFRSFVETAARRGFLHTSMTLLFGVRYEEDLFWVREFRALQERSPAFRFDVTLTRPGSTWKGLIGRVQSHLRALIIDPQGTGVYVCGSPEVVSETKAFCLQHLAMPKSHVHGEGYI
jgi:CDP-4-dehydro-6-deoxyglucose reductase